MKTSNRDALGNKQFGTADAKFIGAWMTDIDDTIVPSGVTPDMDWINWFSEKLRVLKRSGVAWVPMSGVAIDKLAPRILDRLPRDVRSDVIYYAGDGSQKYQYDRESDTWSEDTEYRRIFSDEQALAIIGREQFLKIRGVNSDDAEARCERAAENLKEGGFDSPDGIIGEMCEILASNGFDPSESEVYFRGGSVSWMMLGDISAEPYAQPEAVKIRRQLIEHAESRLEELEHLRRFGPAGVYIPFHGSRGIKFVMHNNDKERATRDLMEDQNLKPGDILFTGNELFDGGNDNVIRRIEGVTLVSVGHRTDPGTNVIEFGNGIEAHNVLMSRICSALDGGASWSEILKRIRSEDYAFS